MRRALLVMAKRPECGKTKTRLSPPLTGEQAVALYHGFLLDTLELMTRVSDVQPIVAYTPADAEPFFRALAPPGFDYVLQKGADLGQRLDYVLTHCLANGYSQAVAIDSDSPTLPVVYVEHAFHLLDDPRTDIVLGPCDDGGYYLIGLKRPCPPLFRITMSTPRVVEDTLAIARQEGLAVALLPEWYDIDQAADLLRLQEELRGLPHSRAPHTRAALASVLEISRQRTP